MHPEGLQWNVHCMILSHILFPFYLGMYEICIVDILLLLLRSGMNCIIGLHITYHFCLETGTVDIYYMYLAELSISNVHKSTICNWFHHPDWDIPKDHILCISYSIRYHKDYIHHWCIH